MTQGTQTPPPQELTGPNADVLHHLLILAAEDLRNHRPTAALDDGGRLVLARHLADDPQQARQLLTFMPRIDRPTTRGEYSLIVADAAKGV